MQVQRSIPVGHNDGLDRHRSLLVWIIYMRDITKQKLLPRLLGYYYCVVTREMLFKNTRDVLVTVKRIKCAYLACGVTLFRRGIVEALKPVRVSRAYVLSITVKISERLFFKTNVRTVLWFPFSPTLHLDIPTHIYVRYPTLDRSILFPPNAWNRNEHRRNSVFFSRHVFLSNGYRFDYCKYEIVPTVIVKCHDKWCT